MNDDDDDRERGAEMQAGVVKIGNITYRLVEEKPATETLLSVQQTASRLNVSRSKVYNMLRAGAARGGLDGIRMGRTWRVAEDEVRRFLASARAAARNDDSEGDGR